VSRIDVYRCPGCRKEVRDGDECLCDTAPESLPESFDDDIPDEVIGAQPSTDLRGVANRYLDLVLTGGV
jgi:hypothetical protein